MNVINLFQSREENLVPREELAQWFRETARALPSALVESKPLDLRARTRELLKAMPPNGEIYWHGANGKPCPCAGCCAGAAVVIFDATTIELGKKKARLNQERTSRRRDVSASRGRRQRVGELVAR